MSIKRPIKNGTLLDRRVLFQVYEVESRLELFFFAGQNESEMIKVSQAQIDDTEWMYYKALAFIQDINAKAKVTELLHETNIETY